MAKDPRFNFFPDNWSGGTKRMNFEQKGAYLELILLNFYCLSDGLPGFTEEEALKALAPAAASAELWKFLMPKFKRDGVYFFSERMHREFHKAKKSSEKQSERAKMRWQKPGDMPRHIPVNDSDYGYGYEDERKGVQGKTNAVKDDVARETFDILSDESLSMIFDENLMEIYRMRYKHLDIAEEFHDFKIKVRGSPEEYGTRNSAGLRQAFQHQLRTAKPKTKNATSKDKSTEHVNSLVEGFKLRHGIVAS